MVVSIFALTMTTPVFAAEPTGVSSRTENRMTQIQKKLDDRKAQIDQKKADIEAFKAAAELKRDAAKSVKEQNKALLEQNKVLRTELRSALRAIKDNEQALDPLTVEQLEIYRESLKLIATSLSDTKGEIKTYLMANKGYARELNYEALDLVFAEVSSIQSNRNEKLLEVNRILTAMLALL